MALVVQFISIAIQAYIFLIFAWVLGSWFPQWRSMGWYRLIEDIVTPYMNIFRPLRLRFGMVDLTPMAALLVLIACRAFVQGLAG